MINILYLHAGAEMYGADKVLFDLIRNLDKTKFTPFVILPADGVLVSALKGEGINTMILPYPIMRRKYFNVKGIINYTGSFIKYSRILSRIAKKYNIDMIHCNTAATVEGCYVSRKLHIPLMWCIHEIIVKPKFMFKFTSKLISRYSNLTVTVSRAAKKHLMESGYFKDNSIKVIHNGVDSERFNPDIDASSLRREWGIPGDALVIGMIGRVNSWKGQSDFLKAANIVMEKNKNVYTVFAGSAFAGEEWREENLQSKIESSPYKKRIIDSGYRKDSEIVHKLIDIFVLPSTNPDPLPTVVLEAMATGNPVVGYRHGGICEMVKEDYNGLFAKVCDPQDLARKINILVNDEGLRTEMGEHSRKRLLQNFSMKAYVNKYSATYEGLVR